MEMIFYLLFILGIAAISFVLFLLILSELYKTTSIILSQTINALRLVFETKVMIEQKNTMLKGKDIKAYFEWVNCGYVMNDENTFLTFYIYKKKWHELKFRYIGKTNYKDNIRYLIELETRIFK